jgi:hypothetical protein
LAAASVTDESVAELLRAHNAPMTLAVREITVHPCAVTENYRPFG